MYRYTSNIKTKDLSLCVATRFHDISTTSRQPADAADVIKSLCASSTHCSWYQDIFNCSCIAVYSCAQLAFKVDKDFTFKNS